MRNILRFCKPYRKYFALGPLFKLVEAIFELIVPLVMANMIDRIPQVQQSGDLSPLWRGGGLMVLFGLLGLGSTLVCQVMASKASQGIGTDLRREVFRHIQRFGSRELDRFGTPSLITRLTADIQQVQIGAAYLIRLFVRAPFLVIGAMLMAMRIDLQLSLVFLAIVPLVALVLFLVMHRSVPLFRTVQQKTDRIGLITRENCSGARVVRAFRKQDKEKQRFDAASDDVAEHTMRIGRLNALLAPSNFLLLNLGMAAVLWFGGQRVYFGSMTRGEVVAFVNYLNQILLALVVVANLVVTFTKAYASAVRVEEVLSTEPSMTAPEQAMQPDPARRGEVELEHVRFRYPDAGGDALQQINLHFAPGESIGVIGGTGSGKSTLAQLLPRLYDATEGHVRISGVDVRDMAPEALHEQISMVPQGNLLFSGSVQENLSWRKPDATDDELWQALRVAQAEDVVRAMPGGLNATVSRGGVNFSGGQKQRLTIARAVLGHPAVLILDDASSALDYATDAALRHAIAHLQPRPTVLMISQRVSTVRTCDRIVVMEDGRVVGVGRHEALLQSCVAYQEICRSQGVETEVAK